MNIIDISYASLQIDGGKQVASSLSRSDSGNNDIRVMGEALLRISRILHEHTQKLEVAVEGKYANEASDSRVRLLSGSLHISNLADKELSRLSYMLRQIQDLPQ